MISKQVTKAGLLALTAVTVPYLNGCKDEDEEESDPPLTTCVGFIATEPEVFANNAWKELERFNLACYTCAATNIDCTGSNTATPCQYTDAKEAFETCGAQGPLPATVPEFVDFSLS